MRIILFTFLMLLSLNLVAKKNTVDCIEVGGDEREYEAIIVFTNSASPDCPLIIKTKNINNYRKKCDDCYLQLYQQIRDKYACWYKNPAIDLKCKKL